MALRRVSRALVVCKAFSLAARSVSMYSLRILLIFYLNSYSSGFLLAWIFYPIACTTSYMPWPTKPTTATGAMKTFLIAENMLACLYPVSPTYSSSSL